MKKFVIVFLAVLFCVCTVEAKYQKAYYKPSTGKYVNGHYKTTANYSKFDNYSTKGNHNFLTGKKGYKNPYKNPCKKKSYK